MPNLVTGDAASATAPTARYHYAAARCAEQSARSISVRRSVGSIPASDLDAAKAVQSSYYLLAAAYRSATHRLERGERLRIRLEAILRPAVRSFRTLRDW
jgi:hypothetical protein